MELTTYRRLLEEKLRRVDHLYKVNLVVYTIMTSTTKNQFMLLQKLHVFGKNNDLAFLFVAIHYTKIRLNIPGCIYHNLFNNVDYPFFNLEEDEFSCGIGGRDAKTRIKQSANLFVATIFCAIGTLMHRCQTRPLIKVQGEKSLSVLVNDGAEYGVCRYGKFPLKLNLGLKLTFTAYFSSVFWDV